VTFRYADATTGQTRDRTLPGEDFLWLVLQHVLPKGFRRVRDYGFLHGNAKRLLRRVQLVLRVMIEAKAPRARPAVRCPHCRSPMRVAAPIGQRSDRGKPPGEHSPPIHPNRRPSRPMTTAQRNIGPNGPGLALA
jgi:hypothetical protein